MDQLSDSQNKQEFILQNQADAEKEVSRSLVEKPEFQPFNH